MTDKMTKVTDGVQVKRLLKGQNPLEAVFIYNQLSFNDLINLNRFFEIFIS
jgi:hypothetical protein